jgi:hypothetical protein
MRKLRHRDSAQKFSQASSKNLAFFGRRISHLSRFPGPRKPLKKGRFGTARYNACSHPPPKPRRGLGFPSYISRVRAISGGVDAPHARPVGDFEHIAGPFLAFFRDFDQTSPKTVSLLMSKRPSDRSWSIKLWTF